MTQCLGPTATQRTTTEHPTRLPGCRSKRIQVSQAGPRPHSMVRTRSHVRDLSAFYYACRQKCFVLSPPVRWLPLHRKAGLRPVRRALTSLRRHPSRSRPSPAVGPHRRLPSHPRRLRRLSSVRIRNRRETVRTDRTTVTAGTCWARDPSHRWRPLTGTRTRIARPTAPVHGVSELRTPAAMESPVTAEPRRAAPRPTVSRRAPRPPGPRSTSQVRKRAGTEDRSHLPSTRHRVRNGQSRTAARMHRARTPTAHPGPRGPMPRRASHPRRAGRAGRRLRGAAVRTRPGRP